MRRDFRRGGGKIFLQDLERYPEVQKALCSAGPRRAWRRGRVRYGKANRGAGYDFSGLSLLVQTAIVLPLR